MPTDDWIWIEEAVADFGRSRAWLDEQIRHGTIRYQKFEGDRRTYVWRADVKRVAGDAKSSHLRPRHDEQVG